MHERRTRTGPPALPQGGAKPRAGKRADPVVAAQGAIISFSDVTEAGVATERLRQYRLMFESAPVAINITRGAEITYANPRYLEMFGFASLEELKRPAPLELFAPEWRTAVAENIRRRSEGLSVPDAYEAECLRKDGSRFPILMYLTHLAFPDGPATVAFIIDITERKAAEAAREKAEAELRAVVDSTADLIWSVDPDNFGLLSFNRGLSDYFQQERGLSIKVGDRPDHLLPTAETAQVWRDLYERALREGSFTTDYDVVAGTRVLQLHLNVLSRNGSVFGISVFGRDITEQRRATEALRQSEERFRTLFDFASDAIMMNDPAGNFIEVNRTARERYGYTREELLAMSPADINAPETASLVSARMETLLRQGTGFFETVHLKRDGTRIPIELGSTVIDLGDRKAILSIARDITERKRTNRERDRMAAAVEQSPNGIVIVDADLRIAHANPVFAAGVGRTPAELVGRSAVEVMSIGTDQTTVADATRAVGAGQPWVGEVDHRNPDGTVSHLDANVSPMREANGEISGWLGVMRDETERERAKAELAASEARLRTALDTMLDAVVVASAVRDETGRIVDFRVEYVNPAIGPLSGVPASDQVGHTVLEQFPAHRTDGLFEAYVGVVETGVTYQTNDFHYVDPDAAGGPLDQYVDQYVAKMGDGYVLSIRDVTERHQAERQTRRLSMAVEQSQDAIVILDSGLRITYANAAFAAVFGRDPSEVLGQAVFELVGEVLDAARLVSLAEVAASARPWLGEMEGRRPDGSAGWAHVRITPRLAADGSVEDFVINFRDVTDLRRAETERARHDHDVELATRRAALEERSRLSRELHDGLAQDLWLAKLKAGRLATMLRRQPEAALLVRQLTDALDSGLADARAAMTTLRSTHDAPLSSLSKLLRDEIDDLSDRFGLPIELVAGPELPALSALGQAQILRIVREALTNARRHANATLVRVSLEALEGGLSVTVRDDGRGFDPGAVPPSSRGLAGMRERATLIGGSLTINSRPSAGTTVVLRVPVGPPGGTGVEARL